VGAFGRHYPVFGALALYAAGVLFVRPWADLPLNDDWVYALDVVRSVERGALNFLGIEFAWGIPQVWLGSLLKPVRLVHLQLRALNVACSLLSIGLLYLLLLRATRNKPLLLLLLAGFAAFPPFFISSLTFMSDPLFLLLVIIVSLLLHEAARRRSAAWLAVSAAFCLSALLQRQYGVLFALPLLVVGFALPRRGWALAAAGCSGAALLGVTFALAGWWMKAHSALQLETAPGLTFCVVYQAGLAVSLVFFTGLLVAPAFLSLRRLPQRDCPPPRGRGSANRWIYLLLALFVCLMALRMMRDVNAPFVGNFLSAYGVFRPHEVLMGAREVNLSLPLRVFIGGLGFFFFVPALARLSAKMRPGAARAFLRERPEIVAPLLFGGLYAATLASRTVFFDRYYLPLLPAVLFAAALLLDDARVGRRALVGLVAALVVMGFTATTTRDYFSWNAAKWELAGRAMQRFGSVGELDGGYEWNGWNGKVTAAHPGAAQENATHFLSLSPQFGSRIVDAAGWRSLWPPHNRQVYLIEKNPLPHRRAAPP
jgi:hypothetical protein